MPPTMTGTVVSLAVLLTCVSMGFGGRVGVSCPSLSPGCIRGGGSDTIAKLTNVTTADGCCAACTADPKCVAFQLVNMTSQTEPQVVAVSRSLSDLDLEKGGVQCWLMATTEIKPNPPSGEQCQYAAMPTPPPPTRNFTSPSGVWVQHGTLMELANLTFLVGGDLAMKWSDLEVAPGVWNFSTADQLFFDAAAAGFHIETGLLVGPDSPLWIYDPPYNVPNVSLASPKGWNSYPYYLDPTYKTLFLNAIHAYAEHIATLPSNISSRIVASQAMFGSTGDYTPWHGTPVDGKYNISQAQWVNYTLSTIPTICETYGSRNIRVLWNLNDTLDQSVAKECPRSYFKAGMVSHGLQVNYEAVNTKYSLCHEQGMHCRGESWPFSTQGYFSEAPLWETYWHLWWLMTFGVDIPGLSQPQLVQEQYKPFYDLFNKYAQSMRGPVTEETHPGGIVFLRDGLDYADDTRFPNSTYGPAQIGNEKRLKAVVAAFADHGAAVEDPEGAMADAISSRRRKGMNDAGWLIWSGNYGNHVLAQLNPSETSVGWWRVGNKDQPYGRYARGFHVDAGKTAMGFQLDTAMFGGLPLSGSGTNLDLRLVYFDGHGLGSFELVYDDVDNPEAVAFTGTVSKSPSRQWIEKSVTVSNAYFGRRCGGSNTSSLLHGSDLVVRTVPGAEADFVFHLLEVVRA